MAGDKTKITILTTLASLIYITFVVLSVLNVFSTEFHDTKLEEEYSGSALIMSLSFDTYSVLVILCYVADFLWLVYAVSCIFRQVNPVQHRFNVHTTSSQRYGRCIDVETTTWNS